ncbi:hypothetical protein MSPP1_002705 [Malassezia sp. CBS 17886]|nr:hypothetical protein MSPP1_002705 [Malassezia sp. CBS 17886]
MAEPNGERGGQTAGPADQLPHARTQQSLPPPILTYAPSRIAQAVPLSGTEDSVHTYALNSESTAAPSFADEKVPESRRASPRGKRAPASAPVEAPPAPAGGAAKHSGDYNPSDLEKDAGLDADSARSEKHEGDVRGGNRKFEARVRKHWYQFWRFKNPPPPPPPSLDTASELPLGRASIFSDWSYNWITPLLVLGYRRPLEAEDLWKMDGPRRSEELSNQLLRRWDARVQVADAHNARVASGARKPGAWTRFRWRIAARRERAKGVGGDASVAERMEAKMETWRSPDAGDVPPSARTPELERRVLLAGKVKSACKQANLALAMMDLFRMNLIVAFSAKLLADTAYLCSALLIEKLIVAVAEHKTGLGCGYAVIMFVIMVISNILSNRFFYESLYTGVFARAALITSIYKRALKMQGRDRSTGKLVNHVSTDVSRIDFGAGWWLLAFTAPVEIIVCLIILLARFGYPSLSGFALLVLVMPMLIQCMKYMYALRAKSMEWTDRRARRTQEVLSGMRIVKLFSYESNFLQLISNLRRNELVYVFKLTVARAGIMAVAIALPLLAGVLAVITYWFVNTNLDPQKIFPAITLFNLLRLPLMFLPFGISVITDGMNSFNRLRGVFYAQQHDTDVHADPAAPYALHLDNAQFAWENVEEDPTLQPAKSRDRSKKKTQKQKKLWAFLRRGRPEKGERSERSALRFLGLRRKKEGAAQGKTQRDTAVAAGTETAAGTAAPRDEDRFAMAPLSLTIARGELCAIIGPVGSGKSSLILGAIGEMQRTGGEVTWGSKRIAYCSQSAWIQNATVRDNILFGQPWDEERYWACIDRAELPADLTLLQNGDLTEIGERGVTLSGGQKQRVSIARALYYDADIVCLDDPLSAVDAHVGKALFKKVVLQLRAEGRAVILVTHAIQYLPQADKVVAMDDGAVEEVGTYDELMRAGGNFAQAMANYGLLRESGEEADADELAAVVEGERAPHKALDRAALSKEGGKTMEDEERNTGSVDGHVYASYLRAGRGWLIVPVLILSASAMQAVTNLSSYWIVWWQGWQASGKHELGFSIGLYVMLGMMQLLFNFTLDVFLGVMTFFASRKLHDEAMKRVMYAPMSWFDTTPLGRVMNRFGKDIDVLDNQLSNLLRQCVSTVMSILGAAIMTIVLTYYFAIVVVFIFVVAYIFAQFYRSSAREFKRVDAMLRSRLYSHFAESLSGLTTIRAYHEADRFLGEIYERTDLQNRAYFLTITNQRWLGLRLDMLSTICVLVVGILAATGAASLTPSTAGVVLSLIVTIAQTLGFLTRQLTELENEMNSSERLVYYAEQLDEEAPQQIQATAPPPSWPEHGTISFDNVWLQYRRGLPMVLKGVDLDVGAAQKVGIVGRTGAGKSSILTVLLRLSELTQGRIVIDGVDVAKIGLEDLRRAIAILPQEPLLFSGTLRSNLDPFGTYEDARLWDAMHRSYLTSGAAPQTIVDAAASAQVPAAADVPATADASMAADVPTAADMPTTADVDLVQPETAQELEPAAPETPAEGKSLTRLTLDSIIDEEGANLSVGQRSLVSLARALVRNSKIILLDEATASVDLDTDAKIQHTIRTEFQNRTLLCIAHRLSTIIGYDRVVVMDDGRVAEFESPLVLFDDANSIFRGIR